MSASRRSVPWLLAAMLALVWAGCGDVPAPSTSEPADETPSRDNPRRDGQPTPSWDVPEPGADQPSGIPERFDGPWALDGDYGVLAGPEIPELELAPGPAEIVAIPACPTAVARARVLEGREPVGDWATTLDLALPAVIGLDGLESHGGGPIVAWDWYVLESPWGAGPLFAPNPTTASPTMYLSLPGTYQLGLEVRDADGWTSCDMDVVTVTGHAGGGIVVEMLWNPDASRDADVDLHFMREGGIWDTSDDCHWKNGHPNWGDPQSTDDDPQLSIDDVHGPGPEHIYLGLPLGTSEAPLTYATGVYFFSDHANGPVAVTVRVYVDGVLRLESTRQALADGQFWDVARITWPTREVRAIDYLYVNGFP